MPLDDLRVACDLVRELIAVDERADRVAAACARSPQHSSAKGQLLRTISAMRVLFLCALSGRFRYRRAR